MSDEEQNKDSGKILTAQFKDGQLQIVEVPSNYKEENQEEIPTASVSNDNMKFMHVFDSSGKNMVVDLLNFTLVRGDDGDDTYRLVSNSEADSSESDATVTCVLSNDDGDEQETSDYVMMNGEEKSVVLLQSPSKSGVVHPVRKTIRRLPLPKKQLTPVDILERAKALQKAKSLMAQQSTRAVRARTGGGAGAKRGGGELPPAHELLASPNFKLYLYACKLCRFRCNAIRDLTAHRVQEHGGGSSRYRGAGRSAAGTLQCARCPFRASAHTQLMKHVQDKHLESAPARVHLDSAEVEAADVLVCGACGFESAARDEFRQHIENEHGATTA